MAFVHEGSGGRHLLPLLSASLAMAVCSAGRVTTAAEPPPEVDTDTDTETADADPLHDELVVTPDSVYATEVRGYRLRPTDETPAFAETLDVGETAKAMTSLGDELSHAVGVEVRSAGGLGAFGAASIRGSTAKQVPVYLDGIEIQPGGTSVVDLSDFSLDAFDTVEVYRGSTPLSVGWGGIGGALYLKTRSCEKTRDQAAVTYGSWHTWRGFGATCAVMGRVEGLALFTAEGSGGDFPYLNRNGTPLDTSDDLTLRRTNSRHTGYSGLVKVEGPVKTWRLTAANALLARAGGVPGVESVPSRRAASKVLGDGVTLKAEGPVSDAVRAEVLAGYTGRREAFLNPELEFNQGAYHIASRTHALELGILGGVNWSGKHESFLRAQNRFETFRHEEKRGGIVDGAPEPMKRLRTALGLEHDFRPRPSVLLSPLIRMELFNARYPGSPDPVGDGALDPVKSDAVYWSPALGARWEVQDGLVLRANGGRYVRAPDMTELFGYSGSVTGNPKLEEEVGVNADAGATFERVSSGPLSRVRLDGAWFGTYAKALIAYEQTSQNTVRPENVGKAVTTGAEASLGLVIEDALFFDARYTYLWTVNRSNTPYYRGNRLPGLPAHALYTKLEAKTPPGAWGGGAWLDADFAAETYLKRSNQPEFMVPARVLLGCGYRLFHRRSGFTLTLAVRNLMNRTTFKAADGVPAPLADYVGFPLPGRTILLTLHWQG